MENLNLISVRQGNFQLGICLHFFAPKLSFPNLWGISRQHGGYQTFNCLVFFKLFSLHNLILRDHIFRRNLSITSFAVTRKNKSLKKSLMKQMQLLRRKSKYKWVANGKDDIFWQNLLNQKSRDSCWKKNFRLPKESFSSLHVQLSPCSCRP